MNFVEQNSQNFYGSQTIVDWSCFYDWKLVHRHNLLLKYTQFYISTVRSVDEPVNLRILSRITRLATIKIFFLCVCSLSRVEENLFFSPWISLLLQRFSLHQNQKCVFSINLFHQQHPSESCTSVHKMRRKWKVLYRSFHFHPESCFLDNFAKKQSLWWKEREKWICKHLLRVNSSNFKTFLSDNNWLQIARFSASNDGKLFDLLFFFCDETSCWNFDE